MTMKDLLKKNQILKGDLSKQEIKIQHLISDIAFLKEANALLKQSTLDSHENAAKEKIPAWPREL